MVKLTDKQRAYQKKYRATHKEKCRAYNAAYREKHREKYLIYLRNYRKTPVGIKSNRIAKWKFRGLVHDDYDALYDAYQLNNKCDVCKCDYSATVKCMDHDHDTGLFRQFLCQQCNSFDSWKQVKLSQELTALKEAPQASVC